MLKIFFTHFAVINGLIGFFLLYSCNKKVERENHVAWDINTPSRGSGNDDYLGITFREDFNYRENGDSFFKQLCLETNFDSVKRLSFDLESNHTDLYYFPFEKFKNLRSIWIRGSLERWPPALFRCNSLESCTIILSKLDSLPDDFLALENLEYLNLDYNEFKSLPDVLLKMPRLKDVSIISNKIGSLSPGFTKPRSLKKVTICENPISNEELEKRERTDKSIEFIWCRPHSEIPCVKLCMI